MWCRFLDTCPPSQAQLSMQRECNPDHGRLLRLRLLGSCLLLERDTLPVKHVSIQVPE